MLENVPLLLIYELRKCKLTLFLVSPCSLHDTFLCHSLAPAGKLEKLKVEQCKAYLRKNGLRLTGTKDVLIQRINEHLE